MTVHPYRIALATLVAALVSAGCSLELPKVDPAQQQQQQQQLGGMQDPSLEALAFIDDALAADRQFEIHMPPPTAPTGPAPGAPLALAPTGPTKPPAIYCDATPTVTVETVCGLDVVVTADVTWSGCQLPPPPDGGAQPQPADTIVTSGMLDVDTAITASSCSPVTEVTFTRHTAYSLTKKSSRQETTASGELDAAGTRSAAPGGFSRTLALDVTASTSATDGTRKEFALTGQLTVDVMVEPGKAPVTGLDGTLERKGDAPETYVISKVEKGDPAACRWPMKGEISRTLPDGQKHVISFGPNCGDATIDGKQVSLNQPQQQQQQPPPQEQQPPQQ